MRILLNAGEPRRFAVVVGAVVGVLLALVLSTITFADGGPDGCNCTSEGQCAFMTCCYSDGLCMPDGQGMNGHKCSVTAKEGGGFSSCKGDGMCETDKKCNAED
jgi:hypothetical protein